MQVYPAKTKYKPAVNGESKYPVQDGPNSHLCMYDDPGYSLGILGYHSSMLHNSILIGFFNQMIQAIA